VDPDDARVEIYRSFIETGRPPMPVELAAAAGVPLEEVEAALHELARADVIALIPGTSFVWLAHPFSAAAAPFRATAAERTWDAICIWDALGILALVESDGRVETSCPDCGDALTVEVRSGAVAGPGGALAHYGIPASRWYEDVGYT
jgi:hypothetical protein